MAKRGSIIENMRVSKAGETKAPSAWTVQEGRSARLDRRLPNQRSYSATRYSVSSQAPDRTSFRTM